MATMVANDRPFEPVGATIGSADNKSSCDGAAGTLNATVPFERQSVVDAVLLGVTSRDLDRRLVQVNADNLDAGVRRRECKARPAVAAAHVEDLRRRIALQPLVEVG